MFRLPTCIAAKLTVSLLCLTSFAIPAAHAQKEGEGILTTLNNPGGGQIIYGPLPGEKSLRDGMAYILKQVHGHFGDRPKIGKVFQVRGGDTVGTFFTLTAKNEGGKPLAGMVIVSMPRGTVDPVGAVLTDDADRFRKTVNPMLQKLSAAWHGTRPAASLHSEKTRTEAPSREGKVQTLHQTPFPDRSGSVGLPSGWHITGGGGGSVHAEGPKGDAIHFGVIFGQILDPRVPQARQSIQFGISRGQPPFVCPYGGDLVKAYEIIAQQNRQRQHLPVPTIKVLNTRPMEPSLYETAVVLMLADIDYHDGKGPQLSSIRIGEMKIGAFGQWSMTLTTVMAPESVADEEWPTLTAMFKTWRQDGKVIQDQTNVVIGQIHEIGRAATARANATHAAEDAHNSAVQRMWDNQDKYSKGFENYQLDQTVVQDNNTNEHATVYNRFADSLVEHDPNRFQIVNTPDYLKGRDY